MTDLLIRRAEIAGAGLCDLRIRGGRIAQITPSLASLPISAAGEEPLLDAEGGALLPGLHDHHIHLLALAAAEDSLACGPPHVRNEAELVQRLWAAAGHSMRDVGCSEFAAPASEAAVRGVGYHESVAGPLDRERLDRWLPGTPLRIQHRSGALWMLNSAALREIGIDEATAGLPDGVERDPGGRPTGRLFRLDAWLRERTGGARVPELSRTGARLARYGVVGVTDASHSNGREELAHLVAAVQSGALPQRLRVMGRLDLPRPTDPRIARDAVKILLDEAALPDFDALRSQIEAAHAKARNVAFHCVTRAELVLALAALEAAGARAGDRIEHASVTPPDALALLARRPVAVVSQPHFLYERGDVYLREVEARDQPWLYRGRGFLAAGVPLAGGTDAPFGDADPWLAMRAAVDRRSAAGVLFDASEALSPEQALALFTSPGDRPGGPPRAVAPGAAADLCLLDRPWREARKQLASGCVRATLRDGVPVWLRERDAGRTPAQSRAGRSPTSTEPA